LATFATPLLHALRESRFDAATDVLARAAARGQVVSAVLHVIQRRTTFSRAFGQAKSPDAMFLLGSISKPITVTALMTQFDRGAFQLDDRLKKFLPKFSGGGRDGVTLRHLLTHVSDLPDQLSENDVLRRKHAPLGEFVEHAIRTPLGFAPGTKYPYSSMAILLAAHVAELQSGSDILALADRAVFRPLQMRRSAQGLGRFQLDDFVPMQIEFAASEAGGGDPSARDWDWNSPYWRKLGAPWGGTHSAAPDIARWLDEFLSQKGAAVKPETARLMTTNHNAPGQTPRGLGFNVGTRAGSPGCSEKRFGHTGSTGTIAWADAAIETICVVLTSLPARAVNPHPRDLAAASVAAAATGPGR
jgi:CubicO group peptidase (beta-lactamase class C family)